MLFSVLKKSMVLGNLPCQNRSVQSQTSSALGAASRNNIENDVGLMTSMVDAEARGNIFIVLTQCSFIAAEHSVGRRE